MTTIAVASGKGGTGKTMLAANLAWFLARSNPQVIYVDTDVEEPNGHLLLHPEEVQKTRFSVPVPALRGDSCSGCGACEEHCSFGAIKVKGDGVVVQQRRCHSCGACLVACEEEALLDVDREMGTLHHGLAGALSFWSAQLDVGEPKAAPLITGLLQHVEQSSGFIRVLDVPPGTSCSAMAATRHADLVVLITEPTPFGLHDLKLAVEMCKALRRPIAVVLNRADLGYGLVQQYMAEQQIPLLAEIPFSREVAMAYARQQLAVDVVPAFSKILEQIAEAVKALLGAEPGGNP